MRNKKAKSFSILSDKTFSEKYNFIAIISNKLEVIAEVQVSLKVTLNQPKEIDATIIGSAKTERIIRKYLDDNKINYFTLKSKNSYYDISSKKVFLGSSSGTHVSEGEQAHNDFIGKLHFDDITIKRIGSENSNIRNLIFFLSGPKYFLETREEGYLSYTGEKKNKLFPLNITQRNCHNFKLKTYQYYFWDSKESNFISGEYSGVQVLEFSTSLSLKEYSDTKFIADAKEHANDLTLILSFISRARVEWYMYELYNSNQFVRYYRNYKGSNIVLKLTSNTMIEKQEIKAFLLKSVNKLRLLREQEIDLLMPITYALSAYDSTSLEQGFIYFFLALERISSQLKKSKKFKITELSSLNKEKLKSEIENKMKKDSKYLLLRKLGIINNISAKEILIKILNHYKIEWKNLYPEGEPFTIFKTRNDIFHSNKRLETELLILEKMRLQVIVEKMILKLLGNKDFSKIPSQYTWRILTKDIKLNID